MNTSSELRDRTVLYILFTFLLIIPSVPAFSQLGSGEGQLRPPAVPLVVHDPFFNVWLMADEFHSEWGKHWIGDGMGLTGNLRIDGGTPFRFMGNGPDIKPMEQTMMEMTATRTIFKFEKNGVELTMTFCNPLLLENLELVARPVTYITFSVRSIDGKPHDVELYCDATGEWGIHDEEAELLTWERKRPVNVPPAAGSDIMVIGAADQKMLQNKGDRRRIEWGYLYVLPAHVGEPANRKKIQTHLGVVSQTRHYFKPDRDFPVRDNPGKPRLTNRDWPLAATAFDLGTVTDEPVERMVLLGYDDIYSVEYFGQWLRPWYNRTGLERFENIMAQALTESEDIIKRCEEFDKEMYAEALEIGGKKYADLCVLAYRQSIAAHKLVADPDGMPLFISKENSSNGSMGTVDVTHPSIPLYLHYNADIVKGMLEFIFAYCEKYGWHNPWAPHDIGKYPIGNGQAYKRDMEYEESGNMILMTYALVLKEKNPAYARKHWETLSGWAGYLKEEGWDPDNQLSTDDFGGRIDHNCNLSIKATLSLASYAKMAEMLGKHEIAKEYMETAIEWKDIFEDKALDKSGDHYKLRFDQDGTWSQKYNLIWDKVLGLNLYSPEVAQKEVKYYLQVQNKYGLPLDSRNLYTKSDWIMWSACLADNQEDFEGLITPMWNFYNETEDRYPMTDWYFTDEPKRRGFQARSVVGGMFMKHLSDNPLTGGNEVVVYPSPGSLEGVEGLQESKMFDLSVNGKDAFVYHGFEKEDNRYGAGKGVSYCGFSFENTELTLKISSSKAITEWSIEPSVGEAKQVSKKIIELKLSDHKKFLVTTTDKSGEKKYFIISAEWPEYNIPCKDDPGVLWLDAGVHKKGLSWDPFEKQKYHTLYLAPGAVLQATINSLKHDNISITGRGIITQAFAVRGSKDNGGREWYADRMGICIRHSRYVNVDGITVLNSPSYQLEFADCEDVYVNNVKLCGFGEHNNDGLHTYGRNILVEDCFIAGNDDRVCITGLFDSGDESREDDNRLIPCRVENVTIRDMVFWGIRNGGDIMLTWNGGEQCRNILIHDIESLAPTNRGFITAQHGGSVHIRNVHVKDCNLAHGQMIDLFVTQAACWGAGGGKISDIFLENIKLDADPAAAGRRLTAVSKTSGIENLVFNNITARGIKVNGTEGNAFELNENVSSVEFDCPFVFVTYPFPGDRIRVNSTGTIRAKPLGYTEIEKITYYINGEEVGEATGLPWECAWKPVDDEPYEIKVKVSGKEGEAVSTPFTVTGTYH